METRRVETLDCFVAVVAKTSSTAHRNVRRLVGKITRSRAPKAVTREPLLITLPNEPLVRVITKNVPKLEL